MYKKLWIDCLWQRMEEKRMRQAKTNPKHCSGIEPGNKKGSPATPRSDELRKESGKKHGGSPLMRLRKWARAPLRRNGDHKERPDRAKKANWPSEQPRRR